MRIRFLALLVAAAAITFMLPVQAQIVVSRGVGLAHDCFIYAKSGLSPRDGIDACSEALKREPLDFRDKAATYDNRGVMLDALARTAEAEADFQAAIRLRPDLGDAYVNLGSMLIKKRQYAEALTHINKGLDLGMSFPHVGYYDRAVAEEMTGHYKEAYYDYKKVLELEPGYSQAAERLKDFTVITVPAKAPI